MTSQNPTLLLIGNPTSTSGPFHRAFHEESGIYETITISALDSPNVKEGQHRHSGPDHGRVGGGTPCYLGREQRPVPLPCPGQVPAERRGQLAFN